MRELKCKQYIVTAKGNAREVDIQGKNNKLKGLQKG